MKREYEFEEWEEGGQCFYVRVEAISEEYISDENEENGWATPRIRTYLIPLEIAQWTDGDPSEIGPAMSETEMKEWLTPEREKKILERIHDMAADAYDAWVEGHR